MFGCVDCGGVGVYLSVGEGVVLRVRFSGAGFGVGSFVHFFEVRLWLIIIAEYHVDGCVVVFVVVEVVGCLEVCGIRKVR